MEGIHFYITSAMTSYTPTVTNTPFNSSTQELYFYTLIEDFTVFYITLAMITYSPTYLKGVFSLHNRILQHFQQVGNEIKRNNCSLYHLSDDYLNSNMLETRSKFLYNNRGVYPTGRNINVT